EEQGVEMDPARIATILDWPVPKSVHDIQVFLGFANFYRRFIEGYSRVVLPMTNLLRKSNKFLWTSQAQEAFEKLKTSFYHGPDSQALRSRSPCHVARRLVWCRNFWHY